MKKRKKALLLLIAITIAAVPLSATRAYAGTSVKIKDTDSLENTALWNNPEDDIEIKNGSLLFSENSTEYTRFISKSITKGDVYFSNLVSLDCNLKFSQLPDGKKFIIAFGIQSIESFAGESGNVEITFTKDRGIKLEIIAYDNDGKEVTVVKPTSSRMSLNKASFVRAEIGMNSTATVYVDGKKVCLGALPISGKGRVGFLQTGGCAAEVSQLALTSYSYDRPENCNISEDFEDDGINVSVLTSNMVSNCNYFPCELAIKKYKESNVLMFKNTGLAYIGTKYKYSNFMMSFDVPWIQPKAVINTDGKIISPANTNFGISFGGEKSDWNEYGYKTATDMVVFNGSSVNSFNFPAELNGQPKDHSFSSDRPFTVRISVVDGVVTAGLKWVDETEFETVLTYKLNDGTPTGYLHIWATGPGNMALDNLKIINLDDKGNLINLKYESGKIKEPTDATYQPFKRVYETVKKPKNIFSSYRIIIISAFVGLVAIGITIITLELKSKKRGKTK